MTEPMILTPTLFILMIAPLFVVSGLYTFAFAWQGQSVKHRVERHLGRKILGIYVLAMLVTNVIFNAFLNMGHSMIGLYVAPFVFVFLLIVWLYRRGLALVRESNSFTLKNR